MAKKTPFHVKVYPGEILGKFPSETDAVRIAQVWSRVWGGWSEVVNQDKHGGGIIAQFDKGELTPEFAGCHDHLEPWTGQCAKAFK